MNLSDLMAADAKAMMTLEEFGEAVVYLAPSASPKSIVGIVNRSKVESADLRSKGSPSSGISYNRVVYHLSIANDATAGMTTIKPGLDKVQVKKDLADAANTTFVVTTILAQDPGAWLLEIMA
jgi:hypothetical protein